MTDRATTSPVLTPVSVETPTPLSTARPGTWRLLNSVAHDRINQVVFLAVAIAVVLAYSLLLPFDYTQRLSFANWHYLDARLVAWSVVLGAGMATVIVLQVHAVRRVAAVRTRTGALGGLAFVGSVLPSMLCCTPIIPTVLAFVGFSTVSVYGTTGTLQHFFATHQTDFFVGSLLLMALTAWWSFHKIGNATCLTGGCDFKPNEDVSDSSDKIVPSTIGVER